MRVLPVVLALACAKRSPHVVPVSQEQYAVEAGRMAMLDQTAYKYALTQFVHEVRMTYGAQPVTFIMAGTDSVDGGKHGWRSCAKLSPEQFGMPEGTISLFVDEDYVPCNESVDGYVAIVAFAGPNIDLNYVSPSYGNEVMRTKITVLGVIRPE